MLEHTSQIKPSLRTSPSTLKEVTGTGHTHTEGGDHILTAGRNQMVLEIIGEAANQPPSRHYEV